VVGDDPRIGVVAAVSYLNYRAADLADLRSCCARADQGPQAVPRLRAVLRARPAHARRLRAGREFDVPVMIHTGDTYDPKGKVKYSHPIEVDEVAVDFRDVTFVICHLGNPWITDAMEVIYKNPNVVGDISGFTLGHFEERFERFMLQQVNEVVAFAGDPSKLLYGTDWPICDMGSYIRFVNNLHLTRRRTTRSSGATRRACSGSTCRTAAAPTSRGRPVSDRPEPEPRVAITTSGSRSPMPRSPHRGDVRAAGPAAAVELRSELAERRLGMFSTTTSTCSQPCTRTTRAGRHDHGRLPGRRQCRLRHLPRRAPAAPRAAHRAAAAAAR
jgi:hypothetical protein